MKMGGCYASDYRYIPQANPVEVNMKKNLKTFFETGNRKELVGAYRQMLKDESVEGFIKKLHEYAKIETAPKEFSDYEIEAKLRIALEPRSRKASKENMPEAKLIADAFDFQPTDNALFLRDGMLAQSVGVNTFYGTEDGEERLALIRKGGQDFKKEKGKVEPYSLGIPFEEYILKRSETRVPTTHKEIIEAAMRLNQDGQLKYIGAVEKEKVDFFLINTFSGREYGCTVSKAVLQSDSSQVQHQLEIEYAGYTPGFKGINLNKEKDIVTEISQLYRLFLVGYGASPVQLNEHWSMKLIPTTERKFDFAGGKKQGLEKVVNIANHQYIQQHLNPGYDS
jgi:hypothetical protein